MARNVTLYVIDVVCKSVYRGIGLSDTTSESPITNY